MKALIVLCIAVAVAVAQDDSREPICTVDSFELARTCRIVCLIVDRTTGCNTGCNTTCNATMTSLCPSLERCTLGCTLARDPTTECPFCRCDDTDEGPDDELNPCRVNVTTFSRLSSCRLRCVVRRDDGCFGCNRTCNASSTTDVRDECGFEDRTSDGERTDTECDEGSICLLEGFTTRCVMRPGEGQTCEREDPRDLSDGDEDDDDDEDLDEDDVDFFMRIEGADDRLRAGELQRSAEIDLPCSDGHRCSDTGLCVPISGPCIERRSADPTNSLACQDDGSFEPLQCRRVDDGTTTCRCVFPRNGTLVPGTRTTGITEREDAPDCQSLVFRRCMYDGRSSVRHGDTFVNRTTCVRCRCNDGMGVNCERDSDIDCRAINPGMTPSDCTRGDTTIEHGTRMRIGRCNMCGCNNGRLTCTDIDGCRDEGDEPEEDEMRCERCQNAPARLVCGRDGRTFRSRCIAMNCSGLREQDIIDGPCPSQPICNINPCREGFACIPLGGRSCLRNEGCTADERRICVNRQQLRCRVSNVTSDGFDARDDNMVCGSDRQTYLSFCHMIQQAPPNTRVVHAGRCDQEECNSGLVCGTDGVTYNSTCHLRALSANAQVDYMGECIDNQDRNLRDICSRVRCANNETSCQRRVRSRDGCCPVCGGITTLAIDRDALDEYSRATDSDANLDEFMARLTGSDVIPKEVRERCSVEVTHVRNTTEPNIEVKLMAKDRIDDAEFCHISSMEFADKINSDTTDASTLPAETSFASAAVAAPLVTEGPNAASGLVASCIAVLAGTIMAALF